MGVTVEVEFGLTKGELRIPTRIVAAALIRAAMISGLKILRALEWGFCLVDDSKGF